MVFLAPVIFLTAIFGIIYFLSTVHYRSIERHFQVLAEKLDLQVQLANQSTFGRIFSMKYPSVEGQIDERFSIRVYMYSRGGGKSKKTYTAFQLSCSNPRQESMTLHREGIFQKIGKAIGMQKDIELRDDDFDKRYILKSSNALFVKELFADPDFREFFIKYDFAFVDGQLKLNHSGIEFERMRILNTEHERKCTIVAIRLAVKIAERLEEME